MVLIEAERTVGVSSENFSIDAYVLWYIYQTPDIENLLKYGVEERI